MPGSEAVLAAESPAHGKVIRRRLGRTGLKLPVVSMGVMNADVPGVLVRAYELGVRHFDTAAVYQGGRSEEMLGNFVKEHGVRDKVVIATKVRFYAPTCAESRSQIGRPSSSRYSTVLCGGCKWITSTYFTPTAVDDVGDVNDPGDTGSVG